ncbi:thiamine pyrophosphate-dependent dehydrogenase E1 component subunit alpha [Noviherbaspirillum sedimenti]|uniref:Thiamine pyrophosphate-dependent dehydrogenase E1 component subunit alpha n=2 Tax=Noviherbaspirillum sedimenti TaxID=2320865 RepID=A0A3A3G7V3_9BURK|nr:thiamine pyrophosphate-dependent dehydrogenase E1 component subunit alpha [Noviherbaspirillum sedimenti]
MSLIKQNDERFRSVVKSGRLVMPYYSPRGQEVIPSAVSVQLTNDDYICTIYRGIHDMLAKGVPTKLLWAELAGRATGTCKGKGGPMHITHPASGVMVTTGVVGSSMPIANGLALAAQIRGEKRVTIAYFGDGASNIGAFHEALNMASVWKLPVIFVCQNNGYAEHTKYEYGTSAVSIAARAPGYSMPGVTVDGNDPVAMYKAAGTAIARARAGEGPTLLEAKTFRFQGHVFGDVDAYMDPAEKAAAIAKDPVPAYRAWLISNEHASEAEIDMIEKAIKQEIDEAVEFAMASPFPDVAELRRDVYAQEVEA